MPREFENIHSIDILRYNSTILNEDSEVLQLQFLFGNISTEENKENVNIS